MNVIPHVVAAGCLLAAPAHAQNLPQSHVFKVNGSILNVTGESASAVYLVDNDFTDSYAPGADPTGGPNWSVPDRDALPGKAFLQWGTPASPGDLSNALWYRPNRSTNVPTERSFVMGYVYYRNGTVSDGTGITGFDLELAVTRPGPNWPNNFNPTVMTFRVDLINTPDTGTGEENADVLTLPETYFPTPFVNAAGMPYFFHIGFTTTTIPTRHRSIPRSPCRRESSR